MLGIVTDFINAELVNKLNNTGKRRDMHVVLNKCNKANLRTCEYDSVVVRSNEDINVIRENIIYPTLRNAEVLILGDFEVYSKAVNEFGHSLQVIWDLFSAMNHNEVTAEHIKVYREIIFGDRTFTIQVVPNYNVFKVNPESEDTKDFSDFDKWLEFLEFIGDDGDVESVPVSSHVQAILYSQAYPAEITNCKLKGIRKIASLTQEEKMKLPEVVLKRLSVLPTFVSVQEFCEIYNYLEGGK